MLWTSGVSVPGALLGTLSKHSTHISLIFPTLQLRLDPNFSICSLSILEPSQPTSCKIQLCQNTCKILVVRIFQAVKACLFLQAHPFMPLLDCRTRIGWLSCETPGLSHLSFGANMAECGGRMSKRLRSEISGSCFNKSAEFITGFFAEYASSTKGENVIAQLVQQLLALLRWLMSDSSEFIQPA